MRILLTNDDGIDSPGIRILQRVLQADHEIWVVAPDREKSGFAQAISIRRPVRVHKLKPREFAVEGTPVDCVLIGVIQLVEGEVDTVISGINRGPNLGTDVLYSGTVGAARQGALSGKPAFALSLYDPDGNFNFEPPARAFAAALPGLVRTWSDDHFLNINFPARVRDPLAWAVTVPARRIYSDYYHVDREVDGSLRCSLQGDESTCHEEEGGDYAAVVDGFVSLTPLSVHPEIHPSAPRYADLLDGRRTPV